MAAIGALYYAVTSLIAWTPLDRWSRTTTTLLAGLTGVAVAISGVLFYLQAEVIHAWCRFCLVSAGLTLALFVCALTLARSTARHGLGETSAATGPLPAPTDFPRRHP